MTVQPLEVTTGDFEGVWRRQCGGLEDLEDARRSGIRCVPMCPVGPVIK